MATKYTVKKGETLWSIAQKYLGSGARYRELGYTGDPSKLAVGTVLNIPTATPLAKDTTPSLTTDKLPQLPAGSPLAGMPLPGQPLPGQVTGFQMPGGYKLSPTGEMVPLGYSELMEKVRAGPTITPDTKELVIEPSIKPQKESRGPIHAFAPVTEKLFPTTQAEYAEWSKTKTFNPATGQWEPKAAPTVAPTADKYYVTVAAKGTYPNQYIGPYSSQEEALAASDQWRKEDPQLPSGSIQTTVPSGYTQYTLKGAIPAEAKPITIPEVTPTTSVAERETIKQQIADVQAQIKEKQEMLKIVESAEKLGLTVSTPEEVAAIAPPAPPPPAAPPYEDIFAKYTEAMTTAVAPYYEAMAGFPEAIREAYAPVATAYSALTTAITNRPSLVEEYNKLMDTLGIPEQKAELARLQAKATAVEEQIETLPEDVKARVKNFLISQQQYERITAAEAEPLTKLYNAIARAGEAKAEELGMLQSEAGTILDLYEKDISRTEEALEWGLKGAESLADLQISLAEKGVEFAAIPAEMAMSMAEAGLKLGIEEMKWEREVALEEMKWEREAPARALEMQHQLAQTEKTYAEIEKLRTAAPDYKIFGGKDTGYFAFDATTGTTTQLVPGATDLATLLRGSGITAEAGILRAVVQDLPTGQQEGAWGAIAAIKSAQRIEDLLVKEGVSTGPIAGRTQRAAQATEAGAPAVFNDFVSAVTVFTANYIKAISGVQVSDRERKMLMKALPNENKQENVNLSGLKELVNFLKDKYELQLGINFDAFPEEIPSIGIAEDIETLKAQLKAGEILVRELSSGQIGAIPAGEFNSSLYEKL